MSITVAKIKTSYAENIEENITDEHHDKIVKKLSRDKKLYDKNKQCDIENSLFEIIQSKCSPYFDIECIPRDKPNMIFEIKDNIIKCFMKYADVKLSKRLRKNGLTKLHVVNSFVITQNNCSLGHDGLSYHLIFPRMLTTQNKLKAFTHVLLRDYPEYKLYIDQSVYSRNRLFRFVYQPGINPPTLERGRNTDSYHFIKFIHCLDRMDSYSLSYDDYSVDNKNNKIHDSYLYLTIISDYNGYEKHTRDIVYNYDDETKLYIKSQTPKSSTSISLTTHKIKDVKQVYKQRSRKQILDSEVYDRCVVLNELLTNEEYKNKIKEFTTYYTEHDNTFDDFRLTKEQIYGILTIIENKL